MSSSDSFLHRRRFLQASAGLAAGIGLSGRIPPAYADSPAATPDPGQHAGRGRIYKAAKWGMIQVPGGLRDKFQLQQELGYHGMELISPSDLDPHEVRRASDETGMPVHGVVNMRHWQIRLSSPDPAEREQGVAILLQALRDAKAFGGDSVLLVPGRVTGPDENHDHVWQRSTDEIRKTLPLASKLGVRILVENVWNGFCETADQMRDYVDQIDSPWVAAYFDIGNCQKFEPAEHWVRTLASRIVKLDCKDWGHDGGFGKIGNGDVDWAAVRQALAEIGFTGWCTAEVAGGGRDELADISQRMDQVLLL